MCQGKSWEHLPRTNCDEKRIEHLPHAVGKVRPTAAAGPLATQAVGGGEVFKKSHDLGQIMAKMEFHIKRISPAAD